MLVENKIYMICILETYLSSFEWMEISKSDIKTLMILPCFFFNTQNVQMFMILISLGDAEYALRNNKSIYSPFTHSFSVNCKFCPA